MNEKLMPAAFAHDFLYAFPQLELADAVAAWNFYNTIFDSRLAQLEADLAAVVADNAELAKWLTKYSVILAKPNGVRCMICGSENDGDICQHHSTCPLFTPHPGAAIAQELADAKNRVAELELALGDAQQWIDSEPDWKDQYMKAASLKDAEIVRLTDWTDLMVDEFQRIRACVINTTRNTEIIGLCDRAVTNIKQRVPVIEQRDAAVRRRDQDYFELVDARLLLQALNAAKLGINYDCQGGCVFCLADYGIDVDTDRSQTLTLPVTFEAIVSALGGTLAIARAVADAEKGAGK